MPHRPAHPCAEPGCPALVLSGSRCPVHQRQRDRDDRPTAARRGYGGRWQRIRIAFLATHPWCLVCGEPATDVDHIIRRRDGGADDPANYQALCHSCHSRKTALGG